jgi:F-type H+-transporting ATPase subunit epsilon
MEVAANKAVLLTESAEEAGTIDVARAEESKKRAQERLAPRRQGRRQGRAKAALERAENRLKIAQKYKK